MVEHEDLWEPVVGSNTGVATDKTGGARQARDHIATAAAHGDPGPLRQDLRVNCPPEWIQKGAR